MRIGTPTLPGSHHADINVIPMIDVLLALLVIFMLLQEVRMAIDLKLPPHVTASDPIREGGRQIVLELRADGSYAINGTAVSRDVVARRISEIYLGRPVKILFVQAAPTRRYLEVIEASDIAKGAGVQVIGFMPYANPPAIP